MEETEYRLTLHDVIAQKGLTDTLVAQMARVERKTVWKVKHKQGDVWFSSVKKVCDALEISLDFYASLAPYRPPEYKPGRKHHEHV